ncbi:AhpC/TSA family protein [Colwellia sp. Arc7-635]|jgi:peroxiredoxin|uniref:peroxiredoxin-like family protein n=1 Tax=Colwellia sp. Arc7-635 TaxID=2497879 RepID=UPI000F852309|nr:peroxiredoxin-like family protein [Colwellia sp. Arc7-635]AZQ83306.1 AhpC/TSA family protein [Colwellia sp. Arc7-635]
MKTLKEQTEAKVAGGRKAKPEFMHMVDKLLAEQAEFKKGANALKLGQQVASFILPNQKDESVSLTDLLAKGPVVVTFYRGSWCPYCNLQLRALQARLSEIHDLGAQLVAISPEVPDGSLDTDEISNMAFNVLSDQDSKVAAQYGVAWEVPAFFIEHMKVDRGLDLNVVNNITSDNVKSSTILPIPATFVISSDGTVTWRYVDVDYRTRSEPEDIITALKNLV